MGDRKTVKNPTVINYPLMPSEKRIITASKIQLPTTANGSDKPHLSCSQISMYLRCPKQYEFRYIDGIKEPPGVALIEGTSHHDTNEINNIHKMKTGKDKPAKAQSKAFADIFNTNSKEIKKWDEKKDVIIQRGQKLQEYYIQKVAPRLFPSMVEDYVEINLGGIKIIGYMDVGGKLASLIKTKVKEDIALDYKITSRLKSEDQLKSDLQLTFYGWQFSAKNEKINRDNMKVGFCVFKKAKVPVVEIQAIQFAWERIRWFRYLALQVANSISLGAFPPCDSTFNPLCSPTYCGYYRRCKGRLMGYK